MAKSLEEITVLDVLRALDDGPILPAAISRDHPSCPVERASNAVLTAAHAAAEARLVEIYGATPLSEIARTALETADSAA